MELEGRLCKIEKQLEDLTRQFRLHLIRYESRLNDPFLRNTGTLINLETSTPTVTVTGEGDGNLADNSCNDEEDETFGPVHTHVKSELEGSPFIVNDQEPVIIVLDEDDDQDQDRGNNEDQDQSNSFSCKDCAQVFKSGDGLLRHRPCHRKRPHQGNDNDSPAQKVARTSSTSLDQISVRPSLKTKKCPGNELRRKVCNVCRSAGPKEGNELIFCGSCRIHVHQTCYGITDVPSGTWKCRPCTLNIRPSCVLCPNIGGAMKPTRPGHKWAHISCAVWIPEVTIKCAEKMEPITGISAVPQSRWSLSCAICKDKGACIRCSVKTCKTAFHVTCAMNKGFEMNSIIDDTGIKLRSYCMEHGSKKDSANSENGGGGGG